MSHVILIRAGSTDYHDQSRLLGNLEMPISSAGMEEVRQVASVLLEQDLTPEAILTAPADPASSTAEAVSEVFPNAKVRELEELGNVDQGLWQGLPESDVRRRYPKVFRNGREKPQAIYPPDGESLGDACERIQKVLNKAIRKHSIFAVVAPDPIATVIRCTIQQRCPDVTSCLCGEADRDAVEFFETNSFDFTSFLNSELCDSPEKVVAESGPQDAAS